MELGRPNCLTENHSFDGKTTKLDNIVGTLFPKRFGIQFKLKYYRTIRGDVLICIQRETDLSSDAQPVSV
jgi:hypothetical protein